jgi:polysaccharide biosynthesis protein PslH
MRILLLTNKPPYPDRDGGAIATLNLTRGLAQAGHEITVLSMNTLKHHVKPDDIPIDINQLADFRFVDVPAEISRSAALFNLLFSTLPYNAVRFMSEDYSKVLIQLLREKPFDIIQLEGLYLCPYIPLLRRYSTAVIAYRAHNVEHEIWERTVALSSGFRKWYFRNLTRRIRRFEISCLNQYDLLIPITGRDAQMLASLGNHRPVHVSPTGIDSTRLIPSSTPVKDPSLFHLGSLEWPPNQEGLLWFLTHCWPAIQQEFPELKFHIAGRKAPQWLITRLNQPGVVFDGEVADAYAYMNSKAIMVVPLHSGSGMRIKIIEGMALGKAIVSTSIGAEGLGTTHGKQIMIADDASSFIAAVGQIIRKPGLLNSLSRASVLFIHENFDNLALAGNLARFYQNYLK